MTKPRRVNPQPCHGDALFDLGAPVFTEPIETRPVSLHTAERWFGAYHYSGTPGSTNGTFYGVFAGDMIALVAIALPTNPHGVAGRLGLDPDTGNHEISRVAVHPAAPRNTASRCIAAVLQAHRERTGLEWVFSYADTAQGHHGGIYQALNAVYVGPGIDGARAWYRLDGEPVHSRTMVSRYGTMSVPLLKERFGERLEVTERSVKHTYVLLIGSRASRRQLRRQLAAVARPYPKREPSEAAA